MIAHFPILVVVVLLISAAIVPIIGRRDWKISWLWTVAATLVSLVLSLWLLHTVMQVGKISYWLGGWEPPWGIEYAYDPLNAFVLSVVAFLAFVAAVYSKDVLPSEIEEQKIPFYYCMYILFITGLMGMVATGDIFNVYVFLEITSLAGYVLIGVSKNRQALMASYTYLILGTIAATFILLGIGYLYMATGTLNMADLGQRLPELYHSKVVLVGFAFLAVGLSIKVALFPLHNWLPNAYTYAPSVTSVIMAATATKVGAYVMIRMLFTVFNPQFEVVVIHLAELLLILSVVAILVGSVLAVAQTNIKKMLAYSSIGQIGYITLGIALLNTTGLTGSVLHILNHTLMKGALFMVAGAVVYRLGITSIRDFTGLGKKMPFTMAAFTVGALSMIGVPLTVGFVSKWYLAVGSLEAGMWYLLPVILFSSLLTAVYFWRVIDNIYFKNPVEGSVAVGSGDAPAGVVIPAMTVAALCVVFGIFASWPVTVAQKAAGLLIR
ncbi:MAG: monovalent cation/H+ antiporter subunit D family protein [Firmicutes bacterium]|nr:monovalent cation/H+ antiporter subunit D family protein [Bacillota bacterium]